MALFKIEKGLATNLSKNRPNTVEGYCYVTTDDGKFYIDIGTGSGTSKRIVLNAGSADKLTTARTIKLDGKVTGSASFDGSQDVTINVDTSEIDEAIAALPNSASNGIKIENNVIKHTNSVTAGTASEGGSSRTLAFGGTFKVPSVTYDAQGHIKSKSNVTLTLPANPNTDTKVTSAANHYTPAEDTSAVLSVDASGATSAAAWNSTNLVTGVNLKRDAKGHVVGVTVDSIKMPSNPDTDTTYTLSGKFNDDGTEYITTLAPDDGVATTAVIPLMTAASATADGEPGLVPKASAGDQAKFLKANGTWATPSNTDKYQRLYPSTNDVEYPITSRYNTTTGKSYYAEYGRYNVGVTLNPAKQTITAPGGFIGTADAAKSVPWSGITGKLNATASEAGLIKVSSVNTSAVTVNAESTNAGRYYPIELNSDGKAIVNVPWVDTNTDTGATSVEVTGTGNAITAASYNSTSRKLTLTKGATYNNYSLPKATSAVLGGVKVGNNITVSDGTISLTKSNITTALGYTPPSTDTDTGATSVEVTGPGNAITSATYSAADRKITLTKGATYNNYSHPVGNAASKTSGLYKFSTDATSHINAVTAVTKTDITDLGIPGTDTNTAHAHGVGAGLIIEGSGGISGTTTYGLAESGVAAGTYGPTADVSGTNNTTINVPQITVDEYGRVTSVTNRVYTSKNTDNNTTYTAGTGLTLDGTKFNHTNTITAKTTYEQSTAAPGYGGTFKITEPKYDAQGHITGVQVSTITMPSAQTIPTSFTIAAKGGDDGVVLLEKQNGSNAVTYNISHEKMFNSPDDLTVNKYTTENSTTSISGSGGSGTIKIPQITVDEYGHVKAASDENVTITLPTVPTTLKNPQALTFGSQTYDGSTAKTITAADLGLSNALHFKGVLKSLPATTINYVDGDVILVDNKEYVCSNLVWVELGDESSFSLKDHTHNYAGSSSAGGAATSANKVNNSLSIQLNGGTATVFDGSAAKSINITPSSIGAAASSHGTHVTWSTTTPKANGTAAVGSETKVARGDHVHPTDTTRAAASDLTSHTGNTTVHITSDERTKWNAAKTHADSAHAPSDAEKNQNAFSNIVVGSTTIAADNVTDSLTLIGSNVTITPDATNDKVTIGITKTNVTDALGYTPPTSNTTYSAGTGLTLDGTTFKVTSADASEIVNLLSEGTSPAQQDDYIVAQYAGGGTKTTTYHRRKVSNIITADNVKKALGTGSGTSKYLREDGTWVTPPNSNTKNTAGATDSSKKLFIIGAESQGANPQTYSHDTVYIGTDSNLYSNGNKVSVAGHTHTYSKSAAVTESSTQSGTVVNASITPSGTISTPTFTGTQSGHTHTFKGSEHTHTFEGSSHNHKVTAHTDTIYSISSTGTMFTATVDGEVLILTAGTAPSRASKEVVTSVSLDSATQGGTIKKATQGGTINETKITPTGTISQLTFTGIAEEHTHTFKGSEHTHNITLTSANTGGA